MSLGGAFIDPDWLRQHPTEGVLHIGHVNQPTRSALAAEFYGLCAEEVRLRNCFADSLLFLLDNVRNFESTLNQLPGERFWQLGVSTIAAIILPACDDCECCRCNNSEN